MAVSNIPQEGQVELMKLLVYEDEQSNLDNKPSDPSWNTEPPLKSWIFVQSSASSIRLRSESGSDHLKVLELWEDLIKKPGQVTAEQVKEIAKEANITVGKWMLFRTRDKVDDTWEMIAKATTAKTLGHSAKVSSDNRNRSSTNPMHVICVYTEDYTNTEDVMRVERELRSLGITEVLFYKPDIYTNLNIYNNNPYHINASVYSSAGTSMELKVLELLANFTSNAIKSIQIRSYFGRKVAIDAVTCISKRPEGAQSGDDNDTSHLSGLFYRTVDVLESGIKPVFVFDGKMPEMKSEVAKQVECQLEAAEGQDMEQEKMEQRKKRKKREKRKGKGKKKELAEKKGDEIKVKISHGRNMSALIKIDEQQRDECKRLLTLMGIPYIEAPCEAKAQCAALVRAGLVYATATDDMDSLAHGSTIVLQHLMANKTRNLPVKEIFLDNVLSELGINQKQLIDLCISLGCDHCEFCKGTSPMRMVDAIRTHNSIENIIIHKDEISKEIIVPENWQFEEARKHFTEPEVLDCKEIKLKWQPPDEDGLIKFMVGEKSFREDRVRSGVKKILKSRQGATQQRLDAFFKPATPKPLAGVKRKQTDVSEEQQTKLPRQQ